MEFILKPPAAHVTAIHPKVQKTNGGVYYLNEPGVCLLARPETTLDGVEEFLGGFDDALDFQNYLRDPVALEDAVALTKFAGQLCYMSFSPNRTMNGEAEKYIKNILASGHGSVLEHANYSFLLYGVSRSFTHELVRHRAGFAFSQVSQRYVDGSRLRFVCRPEFQGNEEAHDAFIDRIETAYDQYEEMAGILLAQLEREIDSFERAGTPSEFGKMSKTDRRKAVNQAARALLPNETEAPIVATANVRAWRHFLNMRGSLHAEPEARRVAVILAGMFRALAPSLFQDVAIKTDPLRGAFVTLQYPKV
jgi:thymidylate synthase (FAD)